MRTLWKWFRQLISGEPHFFIGGREHPYLMRWYLIPRNRWLNVYLHKFLRDDDDRALHDHPWWFVSLMLSGRYVEHIEPFVNGRHIPMGKDLPVIRRAGTIAVRRSTDRHRVALFKDSDGNSIPCWTLVLTGRKSREWGFWCPKGFVPWHEFVASDDHGNIGKGCGE